MPEWITGRNPVFEVIRSKRRKIFRVQIARNSRKKGRLSEIIQLSSMMNFPVEYVPRDQLSVHSLKHQGVAVEVSEYPYQTLYDILEHSNIVREPLFILILDVIQDPQNLGTLLRSAEAVGTHGVLLPLRRSATVTPAVVNASSGASEHLIIAKANLAQSINIMKANGAWVIGLERGNKSMFPHQVRLDGPVALVVGNEARGIRSLIRDLCDYFVQLPMRGQVDSFNAAVAGSIALYLIWGERGYQTIKSIDQRTET